MSGSVILLGVEALLPYIASLDKNGVNTSTSGVFCSWPAWPEAFCAELLPPSGTLRQCLARVAPGAYTALLGTALGFLFVGLRGIRMGPRL